MLLEPVPGVDLAFKRAVFSTSAFCTYVARIEIVKGLVHGESSPVWLRHPCSAHAGRPQQWRDGVLAVPYLRCLRLTADITGSGHGYGRVSMESGDQLLVRDGEDAIPPLFGDPSECWARRAGLADRNSCAFSSAEIVYHE